MTYERLPGMQPPSLLGKVVAIAAAGLLLLAALAFSLVLFAVAAVVALLAGGWIWWKTRALRRQLRERPPGGHVIEGEAVIVREERGRV
jgi:membrane protein implicated in regulation of membrane protease activity